MKFLNSLTFLYVSKLVLLIAVLISTVAFGVTHDVSFGVWAILLQTHILIINRDIDRKESA